MSELFDKDTVSICQPYDTLNDLLAFDPAVAESNEDIVDLLPTKTTAPFNTLICHDFKGGYLHDKFNEGCFCSVDEQAPYRFVHWAYIDKFIYFSHHFITIPPVGWINAGHRNGCEVLGTLILENFEEGKNTVSFLVDRNAAFACADKMVALAKFHKFDGWLLNFEVAIDAENVEILEAFARYLTEEMRAEIGPRSSVIWYDSVTRSGELKWQDALNDENMMFHDACDAIFTNYCWPEEKLDMCRENALASKCPNPAKVYVGIDVFGRNCMHGGNCEDPKDFERRQQLMWSLMAESLGCRKLVQLPINAAFCCGYYHVQFNEDACTYQCFNLDRQSLQPHFCCDLPADYVPARPMLDKDTADTAGPGGDAFRSRMQYVRDVSCIDGCALELWVRRGGDVFTLFCTDIDVVKDGLKSLTVEYKIPDTTSDVVNVAIVLIFENAEQITNALVISTAADWSHKADLVGPRFSRGCDSTDFHVFTLNEQIDGWNFASFDFDDVTMVNRNKLIKIKFIVEGVPDKCDYAVLVNKLSVF